MLDNLKLLDVNQAAEVLGISKPTLYAMSARGEIRKIKINSALRFHPKDLAQFIEQHTIEPRQPMSVA